ncbi:MAG: pyridoxamine 5'-phosphate oxidase family protein [Coriobacteriia bacterium]|nr:pyridoxamine 5'-phosphate oxidase family protein [Coriobacteriia bacterium]
MRGEVRTKNLELSTKEAMEIVNAVEYGVLATVNQQGQPSVVALNHVLLNGVLYFHCGNEGEKLDNIRVNPAASFMVVGESTVHYDQFKSSYTSAVVHGGIEVVLNEAERDLAMKAIAYRFADHRVPKEAIDAYSEVRLHTVTILKMTPARITGKARLQPKRTGLDYRPLP